VVLTAYSFPVPLWSNALQSGAFSKTTFLLAVAAGRNVVSVTLSTDMGSARHVNLPQQQVADDFKKPGTLLLLRTCPVVAGLFQVCQLFPGVSGVRTW
jgi:hypothetical protein